MNERYPLSFIQVLLVIEHGICSIKIKMTLRMTLIAMLALLLSSVGTISIHRYSFQYNFVANPATNPVYSSVYDLGVLQLGYTLQVTVTLPNSPASTALSDIITGDVNSAGLILVYTEDSDPTNVA